MDISPFLQSMVKHWWTLMSCAVFTVLALLANHFEKSPKWTVRATFGAAVVLLFVASFFAWRDQYHSAIDAQARLQAMTAPHLEGRLDSIAYAPREKQDVIVGLTVEITNTGAQSIARDFGFTVILPDGRISRGVKALPPPEGGFMNFRTPSGQTVRLYEDRFLERKAIDHPIVQNGAISGELLFVVHGVTPSELEAQGVMLELSFSDVTGKPYVIRKPLPQSSGNFITSDQLQPKTAGRP